MWLQGETKERFHFSRVVFLCSPVPAVPGFSYNATLTVIPKIKNFRELLWSSLSSKWNRNIKLATALEYSLSFQVLFISSWYPNNTFGFNVTRHVTHCNPTVFISIFGRKMQTDWAPHLCVPCYLFSLLLVISGNKHEHIVVGYIRNVLVFM